jgi:uncharacterized protein (TIGR00730 family)
MEGPGKLDGPSPALFPPVGDSVYLVCISVCGGWGAFLLDYGNRMSWHVYILQCKDGTLYTGITNNLVRRVDAHNSGKGCRFTRCRTPVRLLCSERLSSKSDALKREIAVKKLTREQKLQLVKQYMSRVNEKMIKNIPKEYETGDKSVDALIDQLAQRSASVETGYLLREILTTVVKLGMESGDKGDLKLVNSALKELRYSFKVFSPYRNVKKAIIFGSARSKPTSAEYKMAEEFSRKITGKGYMVVTGGGPGVMEAGNKGAKKGKEFALNIRLPFEQKPNPYVDEKEKLINFKYFFTRKLIFIKETDATTLFPGGFGTNDEGFEALTLIQTGKSKPRPIVLMEPEGSTYWADWYHFVKKQLVGNGYIKKDDLSLFRIMSNVDDAVKFIEGFYRIYHSLRYVSGSTVIRLNNELSGKTLDRINREFKSILTNGEIRPSPPLDEEVRKGEYLALPRLVMNFNLRDYGRLCEMICVINGLS